MRISLIARSSSSSNSAIYYQLKYYLYSCYTINLNIIYTHDRLTKLVAEYYLVSHIAQIAKTLQNFNVPRSPPFDFGEEEGVGVGAKMNFFTRLSLFLYNKFLNYFFF